jgi:hypothetical protein
MRYNTAIASVPANLFAGMFAFNPEILFEATAADREPVAVRF